MAMAKPTPTTWLAIAMVAACYLMAGLLVKTGGMVFERFYEGSEGVALPKVTQIVLSLSRWGGFVPLMFLAGVLVALGLGFVVRRDHLLPHFPIALSMAWMLVLMIIVSAFFGVLLPLMQLGAEVRGGEDPATSQGRGLQLFRDLNDGEHDETTACLAPRDRRSGFGG